jgi:hypothetical protein
MIGASFEQMARNLGCSADTLERRYRKEIEEARGDGEVRILAKTFQAALAGNMRALELSLINRCHWASKPELVVNVNQNSIGLSADELPVQVLARHRALLLELAREDEQRARLTQGEAGSLIPSSVPCETNIAPASEEASS